LEVVAARVFLKVISTRILWVQEEVELEAVEAEVSIFQFFKIPIKVVLQRIQP
jgi:hypothetical protein